MVTSLPPRQELAAALKPLLPSKWRIVDSSTNLDALSTTVVVLKQLRIERAPAAPAGAHSIGFVVTVASPLPDSQRAEDDLDDSVNALIHAIDVAGISWTLAEKVMFDNYLAYDITLTVVSTKEQ